jgi:hypothetical protein
VGRKQSRQQTTFFFVSSFAHPETLSLETHHSGSLWLGCCVNSAMASGNEGVRVFLLGCLYLLWVVLGN